jgi:hypothetical protein
MMMKSRTLLFIAVGLLLLGIGWYTFAARNQEPAQIFPATVNRDCAPWDGSAFTVSVPQNNGATIYISIWQSPNFNFPKTFSFPDDNGQVGNVSYRSTSGEYIQLSGKVFFKHVAEGSPVDGRFELTAETGQRFEGQFKAEWENQMALCG